MSEICRCCTCTVADCTCAGGRDPDRRIDCDGEHTCAQSGCSRYDRPKPDLLPKAETLPTFDYSGLSDQTVATLHSAEEMIRSARRDCVLKIADAVALARDELVSQWDAERKTDKNDRTFCAWCTSVGISRSDAYRLLQVSDLIEQSTPNEQKILATLPPTLLYAAAKPSAPPELVARVKKGEIVTNKAYQAEHGALIARAEQAEADLQAERDGRAADKQQIAQLQAENRELQKRPVAEVLPPDPAEIDRLVDARIKAAQPPPTPDEIMAIYGRMQRYTASARDQWDTLRPQLPVLPPDMRQSFCKGLREALAHIIRELSEEEVRPCKPSSTPASTPARAAQGRRPSG